MLRARQLWSLAKESFSEFASDKCFHLAAALSYYTVFSLAPLLVVVIAIGGLLFGREAMSGHVVEEIRGLVGSQGATAVQAMLRSAYAPKAGVWATGIGLVTLFVGATTVFIQLQDALDVIWGVQPKPRQGFMKLVRDRLLSFGILLGVGFLIIVSLVLNALLTIISGYLQSFMAGASEVLLRFFDAVVSLGLSTLLFAMIFKFLPDVRIRWRDTAIGSFVTAMLFAMGRVGIGIYLGHSHVASTYGAAAALVIVILWVNYSSLILFLGAEFTEVYARRFGHVIEPEVYAQPVGKGLLRNSPPAACVPAPRPPRRRWADRFSIGHAFTTLAFLAAADRLLHRRHR